MKCDAGSLVGRGLDAISRGPGFESGISQFFSDAKILNILILLGFVSAIS
jgi:hypothetical protein